MTAIHDWSKVDAGLFHHFHVMWISNLSTALNNGGLPEGYYALAEQRASDWVSDVLALHHPDADDALLDQESGVAVASAPPRTSFVRMSEQDSYVKKANRIAIRHRLGDVVAVIEIISPGNKSSKSAIASFVKKAVDLLTSGVHLLIVDLFPPSKRDPQGIHPLIWDEFMEEPFELPAGKPLTLAAYVCGSVKTAYVEPVGIGDELPEMPLFLTPGRYVPTPLSGTYETTWNVCPQPLKEAVLGGSIESR